MHKDDIEKADRRFIGELDALRSKLTDRSQANRHSRKPAYNPAFLILGIMLAAGLVGLALFKMQPQRTAETHRPESGDEKVTAATAVNSATLPVPPADSKPPEPESRRTQSSTEPPAPAPAQTYPIPITGSINGGNQSPPAQASSVQESGVAAAPASSASENNHVLENSDGVTEVRLFSALACNGVRDSSPLEQMTTFPISETSRVYVWMDVRSAKQPFRMKHVYYLEGSRYAEVDLDIRHPRMRTWSYVSLRKSSMAGAWTVDILYDGRVLKTIAFQVGR